MTLLAMASAGSATALPRGHRLAAGHRLAHDGGRDTLDLRERDRRPSGRGPRAGGARPRTRTGRPGTSRRPAGGSRARRRVMRMTASRTCSSTWLRTRVEFRVCTRESRSCCCSIHGNSATWSVQPSLPSERELQGDVAELDLGARGVSRLLLDAGRVQVDAVQAALVLDGKAATAVVGDARVHLRDRRLVEAQVAVSAPGPRT